MLKAPAEVLAVGERLPARTLKTVAGKVFDLHLAPQSSSLIVFPHGGCGACRAYLHGLDELVDDLGVWGGLPVAVVRNEPEARGYGTQLSFPVLLDPQGHARVGCGIGEEEAATFVADRWGAIYRVDLAGAEHRFADPHEVISEVRFIGIQCPECGVPDHP